MEFGVMESAVEGALRGGARMVQLRAKGWDSSLAKRAARDLREMTRRHGALFFVNDDVALATSVAADGVHLGIEDADWKEVSRIAGSASPMLVGVSCYNDLDRARRAQEAGASYVAFGSIFPSRTKPNAARASLDLIRKARETVDLPIVAIGGIETANVASVVEAGADAVAVISGLFYTSRIETTARAFAHAFPCMTHQS